jgi:hypothetical protein
VQIYLVTAGLFCRLLGNHTQLPPAAEPPQLHDAQVAGVCAGLLRRAGSAGGAHRVGVLAPLPSPAHRHAPGPTLPLRGILVVPHGLAAQQRGELSHFSELSALHGHVTWIMTCPSNYHTRTLWNAVSRLLRQIFVTCPWPVHAGLWQGTTLKLFI